MTTTVTQASATKTTSHEISFQGLSGAIFWLLAASLIIYIIGFATNGWQILKVGSRFHHGLWESCVCNKPTYDNKDWFKATQAMITIGLIGLILACGIAGVYMFVHKISKDLIIVVVMALCIFSVLFMLIGFIIFGANTKSNQSYSYAFCIIASILCLIAGILSFIQIRKSGVF